ncbi:MAG: nucleotidyltransferase domain-containing protein [Treponema sp.]|nr:nucleotidyltransferase domain-containing protein [Treponema sp.]
MNSEEIFQILQDFFSHRDDVVIALLFGSFAKKNAQEHSDVDIAVACKNPLPIEDLISLQVALSKLCHRNVDLIDLAKAEGTILHQIMTTGLRIKYEENLYVHYAMKAIYFYEDYLPILRTCQKERIRRFVNGY